MLVNCGGVLAGSVQFSMERFLSKRSCLVKQCSFIRQFKAIYKFNSPKKFLERLKRERELELYKSRIITIPNILTISRLTLSPLFPWLIMSGHTKCAFGLLAYCGASDIVIFNYLVRDFPFTFISSLTVGLLGDLIKNLFLVQSWIQLQTKLQC